MAELKSEYSGQAPKNNNFSNEVDELIADANRLIESVYRDINLSRLDTESNTTNDDIVRGRTPLRTPPRTPRQVEIERIHQFLNSLEDEPSMDGDLMFEDLEYRPSLNSAFIGEPQSPLSAPLNGRGSGFRRHVDLSPIMVQPSSTRRHSDRNLDFMSPEVEEVEDDDVIIVSSDLPDVVDLCTPVIESKTVRRVNTGRRRTTIGSPTRNSLRSRSPQSRVTLGTRSVQTSTTHIEEPKQRQLFLPNQTPNNDTDNRDKANTSSGSHEHPILMCPVCMESSVKRKPTSTKCGHVFCETCINQALRMTHKCPICNTKLNNRMLFRIYL